MWPLIGYGEHKRVVDAVGLVKDDIFRLLSLFETSISKRRDTPGTEPPLFAPDAEHWDLLRA